MKRISFLLCIFISIHVLYSQDIKYYGLFEQGNFVIVEGDEIRWAWLDENELPVDNNNKFSFGFDAKETDTKILKFKHSDGKVFLKKINLPKRKYKVQRINNKKQQFSATPDSLKERIKREREIANIARAKIGENTKAMYSSGFIRPISGGVVTGVFGSQRILNGVPKNMHNGMDIAVPRGTPVKAMADGVVNLTTDNFYYAGNYIVLDHGQGLNSMYLHLSKILVEEGQLVKKGDIIGKVGTTGRSTGPHLHWGVQWYSKRVDPAKILKLNYN
jgi:murein DD-endopeptidase MepM/ murein hydrolase activator NlpD